MKKIILALLLIPSVSFASEGNVEIEENTREEIVMYDDTDLDEILYKDNINNLEKPDLSDGFMKNKETVDKYTTKFAKKYSILEDSKDGSVYVGDIVDEMLDDPNVTIDREITKKNPDLEKELLQNLQRHVTVYVDDVDQELTNNKNTRYDKKTGRYYIPQDEELKESTSEHYTNKGSDKKHKTYRTANKKQMKETKKQADKIVRNKINKNMTDEQKARKLAEYLVANNMYDKGEISSIVENNEYGALIKGKTKCDGMAKAYTMLLRRAGIPSMTVYGYLKDGGNHAWNIVKINGKWVNIDLTGSIDTERKGNKINEKYYMKNKKQMKRHRVVKNSLYDSMFELTK